MSLGIRLKSEREKHGWSQRFVAQKVGITNTVLSNYERNYRDPDTETLRRLAELYEVSTDFLLGKSEVVLTEIEKSRVLDTASLNDAKTTIRLLEDEAKKMGLSPSDPKFLEMVADALKILRLARSQDE